MAHILNEYLAGVADSDGSFTFPKHKRSNNPNGYTFRPAFQLTWKYSDHSLSVFKDLKKKYKGSFYIGRSHSGYNKTKSKIIKYYVQGQSLIDLCKDIVPFLRLKKKQAKLILEHWKSVKPRGTWNQWHKKPKLIYNKENDLYKKFYKLNTKNKRKRYAH